MKTEPGRDRTYVPPDFRKHLEDQGRLPQRPCRTRERKVPVRHHDERPNVLWLMADQYRGDMLGFLGHPAVKTPNLDRLAQQGVSFSRSYCTSPVCEPSRASMMTGMHLPHHGCLTNGMPVNANLVTLPEVLAADGYRTANIGKVHCGRRAEDIWEYQDNAPDAFGATKPSDVAFDPSVFPDGLTFIADEVCDDSDRVLYGTYPGPAPTTKSYRLATKAARWLYYHDDPRPFFLRVSFDDPHPPVVPPPEIAAQYSLDDVPADLLADNEASFAAKSPTVREYAEHKGLTRISESQHRLHIIRYMALCTHVDAQIGRVLDALDTYGFAENTLVVFNSDHGHMIGEHGLSHKHYILYEGVNRIPTILRWPGRLPAGSVVDALIDGTDLAPTLCDGLEVAFPPCDGWSFLPVATGERKEHRDEAVAQYDDFCFSLTTPQHKLIQYDSDPANAGELYDLTSDPLEKHNLWDVEALAPLREQLRSQLRRWRDGMGREASADARTVTGALEQESKEGQ